MYKTPRGTRDLEPKEMIKRQYIVDTCRDVFTRYGFDPLETPAFEEWKLLAAKGGEEIKKEIYYFRDKSDRELGLRFDLTVPLARFVAANPDIPKPFRRYQIGRVWRYDRPGAERWREFVQADIDIVGSDSSDADAECLKAACEILRELGVDFTVRINNRAVAEDFAKALKIKDVNAVFRTIDKLDKIGADGVRKELKKAKVSKDNIKKILDFVKLEKKSDILDKLGKKGKEGYEVLEQIQSSLDCDVKIDMSMVRGLEYYTGPIFEIAAANAKTSIAAGGRYDNLVSDLGGSELPATGISLGIDRIAPMVKAAARTNSRVFVVNAGGMQEKCRELASRIRANGIACEYDLMGRSLSKQLSYADSRGIPYVLIVGEKEVSAGKVKLRDMESGDEKDIDAKKLENIGDEIKRT